VAFSIGTVICSANLKTMCYLSMTLLRPSKISTLETILQGEV